VSYFDVWVLTHSFLLEFSPYFKLGDRVVLVSRQSKRGRGRSEL